MASRPKFFLSSLWLGAHSYVRAVLLVLVMSSLTAGAGQDKDAGFKTPERAAIYAYGYHGRAYHLDPGPHLFVDWRYVNPGHTSYRYQGKRIQRDRPKAYSSDINSDIEVIPVDIPSGIRLERVPAAKLGPVITNDKPWEFFTPYVNLIHYQGKYLLFYNTTTFRRGRGSEGYMVCYAESTDGVNYTKPSLG